MPERENYLEVYLGLPNTWGDSERDLFFGRLWAEFSGELLGIEEEQDRCTLYFQRESDRLRERLTLLASEFKPEPDLVSMLKKDVEDWNENWRKSFQGVEVTSECRVVPPWVEVEDGLSSEVLIRLNPGTGFGTGTHETTQLCMKQLIHFSDRMPTASVLDFGSGSGILGILAAKLGAKIVHCVENDPLARENASENFELNEIPFTDHIRQFAELPNLSSDVVGYDIITANILRPVLIEFAKNLVERLDPKEGVLILSGLLQEDLTSIENCYTDCFKQSGLRAQSRVERDGEWRCIVFEILA